MKELNLEVFKLANMHLESGCQLPKKIKITSELYAYLSAVCEQLELVSNQEYVYARITGIPIEVDDTIENEYELVYEENSND